jgi:hypothetical protein
MQQYCIISSPEQTQSSSPLQNQFSEKKTTRRRRRRKRRKPKSGRQENGEIQITEQKIQTSCISSIPRNQIGDFTKIANIIMMRRRSNEKRTAEEKREGLTRADVANAPCAVLKAVGRRLLDKRRSATAIAIFCK